MTSHNVFVFKQILDFREDTCTLVNVDDGNFFSQNWPRWPHSANLPRTTVLTFHRSSLIFQWFPLTSSIGTHKVNQMRIIIYHK